MSIRFETTDRHPLMNAIGAPCGYVHNGNRVLSAAFNWTSLDDFSNRPPEPDNRYGHSLRMEREIPAVFCMVNQGKYLLSLSIVAKCINGQIVKQVIAQMIQAGLCRDQRSLFERVKSLPKDNTNNKSPVFELCLDCGFPIPHGIIRSNSVQPPETDLVVTDLEEGFEICDLLAFRQDWSGEIAGQVFRQIMASGLPPNQAVMKRTFSQLPPRIKYRYGCMARATLFALRRPCLRTEDQATITAANLEVVKQDPLTIN
ncbi:MAG: hypothetical protein Q7S66_02710 [bacterium]|nr:hypothetical protein [bacterium]